MRLIGELKDIVKDSKGNTIVSFAITNYSQQQLLNQLKEDKYSIEIKKYKDNRTLEQNRLLWKLLSIIDEEINGVSSPDGEMNLYITALLKAGAKFTHIVAETKVEEDLHRNFRAVQYIKPYNEEKETAIYRVFYGSSKMDKKEFALLVEAVKQLGYEAGVEMTYWEAVLSD